VISWRRSYHIDGETKKSAYFQEGAVFVALLRLGKNTYGIMWKFAGLAKLIKNGRQLTLHNTKEYILLMILSFLK
jgi:hypothetical protein